ncbi:MAG: hypothetical protein Q4C29_00290 [bacterium]|nr:hypothetical protein [bacterium]
MENNKKTLVLSIIGILILVIAVVGVSFAMFSFSGTGTKENVITTGTVSLNFANVEGGTETNVISVNNQYPVDDTNGVDVSTIASKADFSVNATYSADMTINYEVGITNINEDITAGATQIAAENVKIVLLKNDGTVLVGSKTGNNYTGVTVASLASVAGPKGLVDSYYLANGSFTSASKSDSYKIVAYLDKDYTLPVDPAQSTTDNEGTVTRTNESKKTTAKAEFSFKLTVKAAQA